MKIRKRVLIFVLLLTALNGRVNSYEQPTHSALSKASVQNSVVFKDPLFLAKIGYQDYSAKTLRLQTFGQEDLLITDLVGKGATEEDDGIRSIYHFYNPLNESPLTYVPGPNIYSSKEWIVSAANNEYGLDRFYYYYLKNLTNISISYKSEVTARMFEILGHIVHHVEDMAQPEHVRNDPHLIVPWISLPIDPSQYESYTSKKNKDGLLDGILSANYTPVSLQSASSYWKAGDGSGLAEFTNSNFVSNDTNFIYLNGFNSDDRFPKPVPLNEIEIPINDKSLLGTSGDVLCLKLKQSPFFNDKIDSSCNIGFISSQLAGVNPPINEINQKSSSISFFDQYLENIASPIPLCVVENVGTKRCSDTYKLTTLNVFNYEKYNQVLLPRAISYGAGLIDYLFRGKLEVAFDSFDYVNNTIKMKIKNVSYFANSGVDIHGQSGYPVYIKCYADGAETLWTMNLSELNMPYNGTVTATSSYTFCQLPLNTKARVQVSIYGRSASDGIIASGDTYVTNKGYSPESGNYYFEEFIHTDGQGKLIRSITKNTPQGNSTFDDLLINGSKQEESLMINDPQGNTVKGLKVVYSNYVDKTVLNYCTGSCPYYASTGTVYYYFNGIRYMVHHTEDFNAQEINFLQYVKNSYPSAGLLPPGSKIGGWNFTVLPDHICRVTASTPPTAYINSALGNVTFSHDRLVMEASN